MLHATLNISCRCGRKASSSCPTVADIPAAMNTFEGWTRDKDGHARCFECSSGADEIGYHAKVRKPAQRDLFDTEAA